MFAGLIAICDELSILRIQHGPALMLPKQTRRSRCVVPQTEATGGRNRFSKGHTFRGRVFAPLPSRGRVKRVLIVGAGLSGLIAGYEPVRAGHEVTILEGQERPGGRVRTMCSPFSASLIAEAGAGRISINHDWTLAYTKRFGLTLDPFFPANLVSFAVMDGRRIPLTSATRLTAEMGFTPEEQQLGPTGIVEKYVLTPLHLAALWSRRRKAKDPGRRQ